MTKNKQAPVNLKPQLMYAVPDEVDSYGYHSLSRTRDSRGRGQPVACIPCHDPASLLGDALRAYERALTPHHDEAMSAALTAVGVLPRAKKGGRK